MNARTSTYNRQRLDEAMGLAKLRGVRGGAPEGDAPAVPAGGDPAPAVETPAAPVAAPAAAAPSTQPPATPSGSGSSEPKPGEAPAVQAAAGDKPADPPATPQGEPAAPALEIKLPEGAQVTDQKMLDGFRDLATAQKMTSDQANALVGWFLKSQAESTAQAAEQAQQADKDAWVKQGNNWLEELRKDTELGGKDFEATAALANAAKRKFLTESEVQQIQDFGMQSFPPLVRLLQRFGKAVKEDHTGNTGATPAVPAGKPTKMDVAKNIYTNSPQMFQGNS